MTTAPSVVRTGPYVVVISGRAAEWAKVLVPREHARAFVGESVMKPDCCVRGQEWAAGMIRSSVAW